METYGDNEQLRRLVIEDKDIADVAAALIYASGTYVLRAADIRRRLSQGWLDNGVRKELEGERAALLLRARTCESGATRIAKGLRSFEGDEARSMYGEILWGTKILAEYEHEPEDAAKVVEDFRAGIRNNYTEPAGTPPAQAEQASPHTSPETDELGAALLALCGGISRMERAGSHGERAAYALTVARGESDAGPLVDVQGCLDEAAAIHGRFMDAAATAVSELKLYQRQTRGEGAGQTGPHNS